MKQPDSGKSLIPFVTSCSILVNLTTPVECLMSAHHLRNSDEGLQILDDLERQLYDLKDAFLNPKVSKAVLGHAEKLLIKVRVNTSQK